MSTHAYVEVMPCGCVTGMLVDDPRYTEAAARFFRDAANAGATVEHVTTEEARGRWVSKWPCEHVQREQDGVHSDQVMLVIEG